MTNEAALRPAPRIYVTIFVALLALLGVTVASSFVDWDRLLPGHGWGLTFAIAIAGAKAILIVLYFMHVRGSSPRIVMFAGAGFLWLVILIGLMMTDYSTRTLRPSGAVSRAPLVGRALTAPMVR